MVGGVALLWNVAGAYSILLAQGGRLPNPHWSPSLPSTKTGTFPEGRVMIWESIHREPETADRPPKESPVLLAAAKDSTQIHGGWGFFDLTGPREV
jgi:hypothetical protein